jgi:hypothetical protein
MQDGTALAANAAGAFVRTAGARNRRSWLVGAAVALCTAVCTAAAPAATAAPLAQFNRETYAYSSQLGIQQEAARYQVMVLQATDYAEVPRLKAANPSLKILMYSDVLLSNPGDPEALSTCTPYAGDRSAHPTWLVADQHGQPIGDASYPGNYVMDVGNPAYQRACVAHSIALAQQYGFDGVFLDGVTASVGWALPAGVTAPSYPTVASWQSAMYSLLSYAGPQFHSHGLLVVGNIGGAIGTPGLWERWTSVLDGSEEEDWAKYQNPKDWFEQMVNVAWSEANGKLSILHSDSQTEAGNTFGLASMLLVAAGRTSYSTSNANYTSSEAWYLGYWVAQQLGGAIDAAPRLVDGVYVRRFVNGLVLVNPSNSPVGVYLGGGTYTGATMSQVQGVTMGPWTGEILLADRDLTRNAAKSSSKAPRRPFSKSIDVRGKIFRDPARLIDRFRADGPLSPELTLRFKWRLPGIRVYRLRR